MDSFLLPFLGLSAALLFAGLAVLWSHKAGFKIVLPEEKQRLIAWASENGINAEVASNRWLEVRWSFTKEEMAVINRAPKIMALIGLIMTQACLIAMAL